MRADPVLLKRIGRAAAFALVGAAILAAGISLHRAPSPAPATAPAMQSADPLDAELARCRDIVRPEDVDDACRNAWAEVRRRFFAPHDTKEVKP